MRFAGRALMAVILVAPAMAQRPAISPALSPEAAEAAFEDVVMNVCIPAASGRGVEGLAVAVKSRISPTNDVETRKQAGAAADETVWDVAAARGVVIIREKGKRCVAEVYGPPAGPTMLALTQKLRAAGFEALASASRIGGMEQRLRKSGPASVMVAITGSEPGMPGHQSRFSVITASVFVP